MTNVLDGARCVGWVELFAKPINTIAIDGYRFAQPILRAALAGLIAVVGREAQELPLHCVDPGDIGRNEMIAAPFA